METVFFTHYLQEWLRVKEVIKSTKGVCNDNLDLVLNIDSDSNV